MNKNDLDRLVSRLPSHPSIMGKERYLNAAVLIPLIEQGKEYCFVLQKRAARIRQGGEISFPGGEFEPDTDNNCLEAALRETTEELGISRDKIQVKGRLDTLISPRGITIDSFLAILKIAGLDQMSPDLKEVEKLFLLPVSWFIHNKPEVYTLTQELHPSYKDLDGNTVELLPVQELGLPFHYSRPWKGLEYRVLVYKTPKDVIWGITAELIHYLIKKLLS